MSVQSWCPGCARMQRLGTLGEQSTTNIALTTTVKSGAKPSSRTALLKSISDRMGSVSMLPRCGGFNFVRGTTLLCRYAHVAQILSPEPSCVYLDRPRRTFTFNVICAQANMAWYVRHAVSGLRRSS
eukprot:456975-Amphidinium_carterae.1